MFRPMSSCTTWMGCLLQGIFQTSFFKHLLKMFEPTSPQQTTKTAVAVHCSLSCLADRLLHQDAISASNMICEVSAHEPCQCWNKRSSEVPKFSRTIWLLSCCWGSQVWENEKPQVTHLYGTFLFAIFQRFPSFFNWTMTWNQRWVSKRQLMDDDEWDAELQADEVGLETKRGLEPWFLFRF